MTPKTVNKSDHGKSRFFGLLQKRDPRTVCRGLPVLGAPYPVLIFEIQVVLGAPDVVAVRPVYRRVERPG
jgi:hypothetical protein